MHRSNSVALRQINAGEGLPAAIHCRYRGDRFRGDRFRGDRFRGAVAKPYAFTFQKESS